MRQIDWMGLSLHASDILAASEGEDIVTRTNDFMKENVEIEAPIGLLNSL